MLFHIESNLTLLEGKLRNAAEAKTPENFIKLISTVIYSTTGSAIATATFVKGKFLLTGTEFLFYDKFKNKEKDNSGRILPNHLQIGPSFQDNVLQVTAIHTQAGLEKADYLKELAILEVSYCMKGL